MPPHLPATATRATTVRVAAIARSAATAVTAGAPARAKAATTAARRAAATSGYVTAEALEPTGGPRLDRDAGPAMLRPRVVALAFAYRWDALLGLLRRSRAGGRCGWMARGARKRGFSGKHPRSPEAAGCRFELPLRKRSSQKHARPWWAAFRFTLPVSEGTKAGQAGCDTIAVNER